MTTIIESARYRLSQRGIKEVTIVGGNIREAARQELEKALQVRVIWCATNERSIKANEATAAVKKTDLALLLLRWMRHAHFYAALEVGRSTSVPVLSLKSGYGVNTVAQCILDQLPLVG